MKNDTELTEAGRQYTAAYAAHYTQRDLPAALRLYMNLMESHPNTPEANDSWSQVQCIVNAVVPREELLDAQIELAHAHLGKATQSEAEPIPNTTRAPRLSA